ncbi:MAG: ABC transporter permease [Ruminococcus sp.]|nr:ABC transporter permease [Ruminococcus sp.]
MFSIYKKEVQSYFYTPFAYIITALFMFLFTLIFNIKIASMDSSSIHFTFTEVFYNVTFYFIFLVPIMTMRSYADERKFGTEILLITSPVSVWKIVLGKFFAALTLLAFMLLCSSVFPIFTAMHGGVIVGQLICAYLGFFLCGAMFIALGMLISSFTENSIIAAVLGEIAMFVFLFIDRFSETGFVSQFPLLQKVLYAFSAKPKFAYFSKGFIRLSDVVFFLSAIAVFLIWNYIVIEKRRWNRG